MTEKPSCRVRSWVVSLRQSPDWMTRLFPFVRCSRRKEQFPWKSARQYSCRARSCPEKEPRERNRPLDIGLAVAFLAELLIDISLIPRRCGSAYWGEAVLMSYLPVKNKLCSALQWSSLPYASVHCHALLALPYSVTRCSALPCLAVRFGAMPCRAMRDCRCGAFHYRPMLCATQHTI